MQALAAYRDSLCPLCGQPREVCQSIDAETRFKGAPPTRCHLTTAILRAQDEFASTPNAGHTRALLWGAERV